MKYQHKPHIVDATQIAGIGDHLSDGAIRVLLEGEEPASHGIVIKKHEMTGLPKIADYLVTNEDGTRSLVPKVTFEAAHVPVDTEVEAEAPAKTEEETPLQEGQRSEGPGGEELGDE